MAKANRSKAAIPAPLVPGAKTLKISIDSAKYTGYEPVWEGVEVTNENRAGHLTTGFNWYNYNFGAKDAHAFLVEYLTINKRKDEAKQVKRAGSITSSTVGWLARMTMMGWELNEKEQGLVNGAIEKAIASIPAKVVVDNDKDEKEAKAKFNIQERMREKAAEAGGEIEGMLDDYIAAGAKAKHKFNPLAVLKTANILPAHCGDEIKHWENVKAEFVEAHSGKDKDLKEAYEHLGKLKLRNTIKFVDEIIAAYHSYVAYKKATKKTRKRKVKTPVELARKLKYLPTFVELNLTSEKPAKIVGAKEMFAFDVKKRKLMYFVADEYAGELTIKNNTIDGFDANKSVQKTVRKPHDFMKEFMKASKPNSRKLFTNAKTVETKMSGRFNDSIVILKVW